MKKIFLFLILGMFMISMVSAWEFDNSLRYEKNDMKVIIENGFGLPIFGSDIGSVELKSHKSVNEILHVAPGEDRVVMYYDFDFNEFYSNGLGDVEFINMSDGEQINKDYSFVIWDTFLEERNNYSDVCTDVYNQTTKSYNDYCESILVGTYMKEVEGWVRLNTRDIPKGVVRIGLATNVNLGETIDGVWTIAGKKIKKHAVWTSDLNNNIVSYYKLDNNVFSDSIVNYNAINSGTVNTSGIIIDGRDFDGTNFINTTIDEDFGSTFSANFWVNPDDVSSRQNLLGYNDETLDQLLFDIARNNAGELRIIIADQTLSVLAVMGVGSWQMITGTYDGTTIRLYRNGQSIGNLSSSGKTLSPTHRIFLGDINDGTNPNFPLNGQMDEVSFWSRTLNQDEITQLWNGGDGISWIDTTPPVNITLNSPEDNFATEDQTVIFNASVNSDDLEIVNVSLLIDGVINETNSSGIMGDYIFEKILDFGNHNWSIRVVDNVTNTTNSNTRNLSILDESLSGIWTDEYQIRIIAASLTESDFEINGVNITQEDDNLWKINASTGDYEIDRARVMQTLFSNGKVDDIDGLLKIQAIDERDIDKKGFKITWSISSTDSSDGSFTSVSGNEVSIWSSVSATHGGGGGSTSTSFSSESMENSATATDGVPDTSNEIGTDRTSDEQSNPASWEAIFSTPTGGSFGSVTAILISNGNISVDSGSANIVDYTIDNNIPVFSEVPNITLNAPEDNLQDILGDVIIFNITSTMNDGSLNEIRLFINGTINETKSISGTEDITIFTKSFSIIGDYNWSVEVCDTDDNCALSETRDFEINLIKEINQTFNNETTEGATETFEINLQKTDSLQISTISLIYNGTSNSFPYSVSGNNVTSIGSITIPVIISDTNLSFFWNITFNDDSFFITSSNNQTVLNINVDNCDSFTNLIYNFTQYDEENQTILSANNTIELQINLYDTRKTLLLANFSGKFIGVNPVQFCAESPILSTVNYSSYVIVKYFVNSTNSSKAYSVEYYNILNQTITNSTLPINVALYNLRVDDTTKFRLTFRDGEFVLAPNILVQVHRQYIKDNDFKIVEIPLTDSNGQTVLNLVKDVIIYNFIMVNEAGETVGTFNSIAAFCSDFSIGDCAINLAPDSLSEDIYDYNEEFDISFSAISYDNSTEKISMSFLTGDLTPKNVRMEVVRNNDFGNRSVCSVSLFAASGLLSCDVSAITDTDQFLFISTYVEDDLAKQDTTNLNADILNFGTLNGAFYGFLFMLFMITMFMEDRKVLVVSLGLGWVGIISLGLVNGRFIGFTSAGIWILVSIGIFLWKLNKEESL